MKPFNEERLHAILEEAADDILKGNDVGEIFNDLESNLIAENRRPAPDKTGFEEWYQKYCDESEPIEDRIVDIRAAWNAALSQKEGER